MAETLSSRVGRLVSGSLNALVSAVENAAPETVLKEAIREVEVAIDDVRTELGRELAKKHLASTRLMEENRRHEELASRIELALQENREDLAEAAASQQLDIEAQIPVLERTIGDCGDREKELEGFIAALQAKIREMRDELAQFREREAQPLDGRSSPSGASNPSTTAGVAARTERATSAFERVLEQQTAVPDRQTGLKTEAQLAELADLAHKNRVRERVAAAKARLEEQK
ncbi:MAG: PspA/IM30 family protein [Proteobacteria bacterium]|nr:PspA/IM30 family protein [Pseudomonadota bacterium]